MGERRARWRKALWGTDPMGGGLSEMVGQWGQRYYSVTLALTLRTPHPRVLSSEFDSGIRRSPCGQTFP